MPWIVEMLISILLFGIPMSAAVVMFSIVFWGQSVKDSLKPLFLFSVLHSSYVILANALFVSMPYLIHNFMISYFLLFFLCFIGTDWKARLKISLLSFCLYVCIEMGFTIVLMALDINPANNISTYLIIQLPSAIALFALSYWMLRSGRAPGRSIFNYLSEKKNRPLFSLLAFLVLQVVLISLFIILSLTFKQTGHSFSGDVLLYICAVLSLLIIFITLRVISRTKDEAVMMTQQLYADNVNQLFMTIRGQRHDFLNHVQVIHSMTRRKKYEELECYLQELVGEIQEINELIQIGHPALAALIQAKLVRALDQKIQFTYTVSGIEHLPQGVKSVDVVKMTANLIDNAFDEVLAQQPGQRLVHLSIATDHDYLVISVRNKGKLLSEEEKERIFIPGYSTKSAGLHSGLGLSIVKERVEHYNGDLDVESLPPDLTIFRIKIPLGIRLAYGR